MTHPTTKSLQITRIKFPEIKLETRDAHKLRGYFGNLFKEHSPLLHNHYEDGQLRYKYPMIQYKVLDNKPTLIGIEKGAELLPQLFLKINELNIGGLSYSIHTKNIEACHENVGFSQELISYQFKTLWMALNQKNHKEYLELKTQKEKNQLLNRMIVGNILGFFSNLGLQLEASERLMAKADVFEKSTQFKQNTMVAFTGKFIVNALLPNDIGLGKSVSRGFGTISKQ